MMQAQSFFKPRRRFKWWLQWLGVKVWVAGFLLKQLTPLFHLRVMHKCLPRLPALLQCLPRRWRGKGYSLCKQNLGLLGFDSFECRRIAIHYTAIQLQCALYQHLYQSHRTERLRAWVRHIPWVDPMQLFQLSPPRPTLIVLAHTGEHWMAVACVVERHIEPTRFIIPVWNFNDAYTRASLKNLEGLGHRIEVLDVKDPKTALLLARGIKRGHKVIIFADLPVHIGPQRMGEPMDGHFFGRPAQFVKGPFFLAEKLGCDVILAAHRATLGAYGHLYVLQRIESGPRTEMLKAWVQTMETFILKSPQNWLYLAQMESFFHRQLPSRTLVARMPALLTQRNVLRGPR